MDASSPAVPYYVRSTEAAASNDCYYIYRLGHYNKISKYLVIIQFESCHKSGCKRATVVCWHWRCKLPLLLLLGQHTRTTLPFIGYLPAIAATALPLTGPQSQKALRMCPTWCKKVQILLRGRSTKRTLTWIHGYGRHRERIRTHTHTRTQSWAPRMKGCLLHPLQSFNFHNCCCAASS